MRKGSNDLEQPAVLGKKRKMNLAKFIAPIVFVLISAMAMGQSLMDTYVGGWSGKFTETNPFLFDVHLEMKDSKPAEVVFVGSDKQTRLVLRPEGKQYFVGKFKDQLTIRVDVNEGNPIAFIQSGHHLSHVALEKSGQHSWSGTWNVLIEEDSEPTFYLSLDKFDNGNFGASTFFREPTYHYMFGQGFAQEENSFEFFDFRSGINFIGKFKEGSIELTFHFLNETTIVNLQPLPYGEWKIGVPSKDSDRQEENEKAGKFDQLVMDVLNDTLEGTHSIIISQGGNVLFETYFDGFTSNTLHDTRSLAKSFASAILGIAISRNIISDENIPIQKFLSADYPSIEWKNGKEKITLAHLMTMSSGLDAIDFGLNRISFANEGNYQNQEDWTEYILSAPMINVPGEKHNYGSGNPHLIGPVLQSQMEERLEFFIHKNLFQPLSIVNYRIQTDNYDKPYFGGGWYFTPGDLLKFGQMYLNKGSWEGTQLISQEWIAKSMAQYGVLENTQDKNEYGFLFWHKTYDLDELQVESIEARGAGGQYLFMVPAYNLVVVVTSGNYRNNKGFQPERIMKEYILPEIVKEHSKR